MILWAILPALAGVALLMSSLPEFSLLPFAAAAYLFYVGWRPFRPASDRPQHSPPDDTQSSDNHPDEPAPCLKCGTTIPPGSTRCPSCGWSYAK